VTDKDIRHLTPAKQVYSIYLTPKGWKAELISVTGYILRWFKMVCGQSPIQLVTT